MNLYFLFVLMATATVLSPGPGVVMTLTNALRHGMRGTDPQENYTTQFAALVLTYSSLVVLIHSIYALSAQRAKRWLTSGAGGRVVNRAAGCTFILFGAALATAKR